MRKRKIDFEEMANPAWFSEDPHFAWGFYGHRLNLYRSSKPHRGFTLLQKWIRTLELESFVFTSRVDGHFQKSDSQKISFTNATVPFFIFNATQDAGK